MASGAQIRGALLEEIALHLLCCNGYVAVDEPGTDPTLKRGSAGLEVQGRGAEHQIDAIADYRFTPPFVHPIRLLVEAKSISRCVGINVVRNAYGVLSDVSQFWVDSKRSRYCYQYAVFADTDFSPRAQAFAFAQNIYLFPLHGAKFLRPVLDALRAVRVPGTGGTPQTDVEAIERVSEIRQRFRMRLRDARDSDPARSHFLDDLTAATLATRQGILAVTGSGLPIFLIPSATTNLNSLSEVVQIRITWEDSAWLLSTLDGQAQFSFDLPDVLFERYAEFGEMRAEAALNLKADELNTLAAWVFVDGRAQRILFVLDRDWIQRVRLRISGGSDGV